MINLSTVLAELQSNSRANIIVLDSCRNDPLSPKYASAYRALGVTRGLAVPINTSVGTLLAFSTSPNRIAAEGKGRHSPYTAAFLKWIDKPVPCENSSFACSNGHKYTATAGSFKANRVGEHDLLGNV